MVHLKVSSHDRKRPSHENEERSFGEFRRQVRSAEALGSNPAVVAFDSLQRAPERHCHSVPSGGEDQSVAKPLIGRLGLYEEFPAIQGTESDRGGDVESE
jgi:hypothetical protein